MAKVYLDVNILIDLTEERGNTNLSQILDQHTVYISPLSVHILFYSYKIKVPDKVINDTISNFIIVDFSDTILSKSLYGPTKDLEDNIQLHTCAEAECDYFLTADEKLLSMKFFGKTKVMSPSQFSQAP